MGLIQNGIQVVGKPNNNKPDQVKLESLNGYGSIREKVDQGNTLTVKSFVVIDAAKTTVSIVL